MTRRKETIKPYRVPYGSIQKIMKTLLTSAETRYVLDMAALGVPNPSAFYNSCWQAAHRSGQFRARKDGSKLIIERMARAC